MGGTVTKYPQVVKVPAPTWPGANSEEMLLCFPFTRFVLHGKLCSVGARQRGGQVLLGGGRFFH